MLDFGLARQTVSENAETLAVTQPGTILGTLRYMSPEQSRGESLSAATDIFSLGLVLYELVSSRHPFDTDSNVGVLHGIQSHTPAPLGCQPALDELIFQMIRKGPRLRPNATEIAARLKMIAIHRLLIAHIINWCYSGGMKPLMIKDAETVVLGLQDEIRRSEESRYDHRLHGVLLVAQGMSCRQVSELLGDAPRTVAYWVHRFERDGLGGLTEEERPGRPGGSARSNCGASTKPCAGSRASGG